MVVTMTDLRQIGMCSSGAWAFCNKWGFDYNDFLENGIDANLILATNDGMGAEVVEHVKNKTRMA